MFDWKKIIEASYFEGIFFLLKITFFKTSHYKNSFKLVTQMNKHSSPLLYTFQLNRIVYLFEFLVSFSNSWLYSNSSIIWSKSSTAASLIYQQWMLDDITSLLDSVQSWVTIEDSLWTIYCRPSLSNCIIATSIENQPIAHDSKNIIVTTSLII